MKSKMPRPRVMMEVGKYFLQGRACSLIESSLVPKPESTQDVGTHGEREREREKIGKNRGLRDKLTICFRELLHRRSKDD